MCDDKDGSFSWDPGHSARKVICFLWEVLLQSPDLSF